VRRNLGWALASIIALGFGGAGGAMAADMAAKAPAYRTGPAAVYDWTGWYVGLNIGGALNDSNYRLDPAGCFLTGCGVGGVAANSFRTFTGNFRDSAFTGGGQVGYNRQMGTWLWGFEADINYNGINQTISANNILTGPLVGANTLTSVQQRLDWFGTVRGRVGFLATPFLLLYGTGGLAYGHVSSSTNVLFPVTCCGGDNYVGNASSTRVGWTAGGGAEWALGQSWSIKAEYLYVDLGSFSYADPCVTPGAICGAPFPAYQTRITTREHVARAGINYHFGAPVVAKY
jgi:outer membrane immunogenic protein